MSVRSLRLAVVAAVWSCTFPLLADSFQVISGGNWSSLSTWTQNGVPATRYPGSLAGVPDTVGTTTPSYTVTVDVVLVENITILQSCPSNTSTCVIDVPAAGLVKLGGASNIGPDAHLKLSGGTILNAGTLTFASTSDLDWLGGTISGGGTVSILAGANVNATSGTQVISGGQLFDVAGLFTYTGASQLWLKDTSKLTVKSGGVFDIQIINGIATDDTVNSRITVDSGGLFKKTAGAFGTNIDPPMHNNGTVEVHVASMGFQRGVYTGTFNVPNPGTGIGFAWAGPHQFSGTATTITGDGEAFFGGTVTFDSGAELDVTNMENDSFASFSGAGTINVSGLWNWRGATLSGVTVHALFGSTVSYSGEGNATLTGNAHLDNEGTFDINPGAGSLSIHSGAHVTNDGFMNLHGDVTIFSDGLSNARIDNLLARNFTKTTGSGVATIHPLLNNAGGVSVLAGKLKLTGGGLHEGGGFFTDTTSSVEFGGGTNRFVNSGTLGGVGTFGLTAGVFDVDTVLSVNPTYTFKQSGGTLTGDTDFRIEGPFLWTGGTMDNSSGSGQTIVTGNSSQLNPASATVLSGRIVSHTGTMTYTPAAPNFLAVNNGATFLNTGTFSFTGDARIDSDNASSPRFTNGGGGIVNKNSGAGDAVFFVYFQSDGTINIGSGNVVLKGGGQNLGTVNFTSSANRLIVDNSIFAIASAATVNGNGFITVDGGSARLALLVPLTVENFELFGGTVDTGDLTVGTLLTWTGGTMGPGGKTILDSATLDHSAPVSASTLDNRTLDLNGSTFNLASASTGLLLTNSSVINNNTGSTINSIDAGAIANGAGANAINNAVVATLRKSGGTSGTRIDVPVNNNGAEIASEVNGQSLILNGGGTMNSGQLTTGIGALIDFTGGTFAFHGGTIGGSGMYRILNIGTFKVNTSLATANTFELHTGGTLQVEATRVFSPDVFTWRGGTVQGGGQTRAGTGSITGESPATLTGSHLFETLGVFSYDADAANYLTISSGTFRVNAAGTLQLTADAPMAGTGTLENLGATMKTAGSGTSHVDVNVVSSGTRIGANSGRLQLDGGGTITGGIDTGVAGIVDFSGGTFAVNSPASLLGTGDFVVSGATVNVNTNISVPRFFLTGGALGGTGEVGLEGGSWTGGNMTGSGTTIVRSTRTFSIEGSGAKSLLRPFDVNGTLNVQNGPLVWTIEDGGSVSNHGNVDIKTDGTIACVCTPGSALISNQGQWNRTAGGGELVIEAPFKNFLDVTASAGTLVFAGAGDHFGDFAGTAHYAFRGPSHVFGPFSAVGTSGHVEFSATNTNFGGTYVLTGSGETRILGGQTNFIAGPAAVTPRLLLAANLGGSSNVQATDVEWKSGVLSTYLTVANSIDFTGALGAMTLDGATIDITSGATGTFSSPANMLVFSNGGTLLVHGLFDVATATGIDASGLATNTIDVTGTFRRSAGAGTMTVAPAVTVTGGTVDLLTGTTAFNGGFTGDGATIKLAGGHMSSPLTIDLEGGSVTGNGTITGDVLSAATISPGLSHGTITVNGDFTQTSGGTLDIELAGTTPGTQFDQLAVTGAATLDGTIDVSFLGGYLPTGGETYDVVTFASKEGDFAVRNFPTFPMGGAIEGAYVPAAAPTAFQLQAVTTQADVTVSQTTSGPANQGDDITFTVTITNNGPQTADSVTLTDTFTNATFISATGQLANCSGTGPVTCTFGSLAAGQSTTVAVKLDATNLGAIQNDATVATTTFDPVTTNDTDSATIIVGPQADVQITKSGPSHVESEGTVVYTITVKNHGPSDAADVVVNDTSSSRLVFVSNGGACTGPFPCSLGTIGSGVTKVITSTFQVLRNSNGRTVTNTASVTSSTLDPDNGNNSATTTAGVSCANPTPSNLQPAAADQPASGTLSWTGAGDQYVVYLGPAGSGCSTHFATTFDTSVAYALEAGKSYEWRVESLSGTCPPVPSNCVSFSTQAEEVPCAIPQQPAARVVGQTTSAKTYDVEWDAVPGATRYEIDEATNAGFTDAATSVVDGTSKSYKHDVVAAAAFFYRVRAFNDCGTTPGAYSETIRVVIVPLPPKEQSNKNINIPAGSEELIVQQVFIPGEAGQSLFFNASTDRPWLTVRPASGILPPQGTTLEVVADPRTLPNGTFTASIILVVNGSASRGVTANAGTTLTIPLSINLVTPVSPVSNKGATSEHAMVIPSVGHLDGINSHWQSDVRVTNAGFRSTRYKLTFTPSGGTAAGVKQTTITVDAGATTALDDIIRNWYGIGSLGESASGMLEILPLDDPAVASLSTVASSRTYNVTANGTLGQFIPAIRYPGFVGRTLQGALPQILSLQQVAENARYRTNVGIAEGSGNPTSVLLSIFNASGSKLTDVPVNLAAGEQRQLNSLLARHGIELADGRVEVQVTGGAGKVTAYASVVDNNTRDPLLVAGTPLTQSSATKWVLPGAANLDNDVAHWRTDMRVFNYGPAPQPAALTFFPNGGGEARSGNVLLAPGAVLTLDNVVRSLFGAEGTGGVVHLRTATPANLVVTGRTYNETAAGTFGQFIPAVTPDLGVGANERSLHILQVEDSVRYRTNLGIAEITGRPVTVEVQVVLPDSKSTPTVTIPLGANEFRQFAVIRQFGLGNVYNARVSIRVIDGDGRVTAYGSVIDEETQDPTYVPAQ